MDRTLNNPDLAPVDASGRTWNLWHIASLWVGMSVCIPSYMLASSMISAGLGWRTSLLVVFLGNAIVLVPLVITAHAGTRYGIPFPVFARAAFGTRGTHVPSLLRALVACGWFGIQTWIGGLAIHALVGIVWPAFQAIGGDWRFMDYTAAHFVSFALFWCLNLYVVWTGTEGIKWLEALAAPLLLAMGLALLAWALSRAGGFGAVLAGADALGAARPDRTLFDLVPWVTAMVGYWATLSLNIPDFTRFARSQRDQIAGQALGLLTTMPLIAFIGIAVTSATVTVYGAPIWNPVDLLARISAESGQPWIGLVSMAAILIATLTTNIAANIVAPAVSFSNLAPGAISFRVGGLIAGVVGVLLFPWKLLDVYQTWLISYSGLLGAVGGVLVCDYLVMRRGVLHVEELYSPDGRYAYGTGVNRAAMIALAAGILVALAGLASPGLRFLFDGAWFSAAIVSGVVYVALMRGRVGSADRPVAAVSPQRPTPDSQGTQFEHAR
jgi:nucleobase:cation symporter-1, NCS1 family